MIGILLSNSLNKSFTLPLGGWTVQGSPLEPSRGNIFLDVWLVPYLIIQLPQVRERIDKTLIKQIQDVEELGKEEINISDLSTNVVLVSKES